MAVEPHDIAKIGLVVGQEALVRKAIKELGNENFQESMQQMEREQPPMDSAGSGDLDQPAENLLSQASRDLDTLLRNTGGLQLNSRNDNEVSGAPKTVLETSGIPSARGNSYDPRYLLTLKASSGKTVRIASFLPEKVKDRLQRKRREKLVFSEGRDGHLSLQHNEEDNLHISPTEWGAANMRLMNYLLENGQLLRSEVEFYMAYTMQVFELADSFEWASVMRFDNRYRELQTQHGFTWGDMRLAMQLNLLTPRAPQGLGTRKGPKSSPKETLCKKWLLSGGTSCPFGDSCKFVHKKTETAAISKNGQE
jgi:hypothetical protein